ncbi:hypothetical protein Pelo_9960 [Pelomyxa schiedti]|nr:hypothetical protein Pelo_9960 [Pelomyxa schiedti]
MSGGGDTAAAPGTATAAARTTPAQSRASAATGTVGAAQAAAREERGHEAKRGAVGHESQGQVQGQGQAQQVEEWERAVRSLRAVAGRAGPTPVVTPMLKASPDTPALAMVNCMVGPDSKVLVPLGADYYVRCSVSQAIAILTRKINSVRSPVQKISSQLERLHLGDHFSKVMEDLKTDDIVEIREEENAVVPPARNTASEVAPAKVTPRTLVSTTPTPTPTPTSATQGLQLKTGSETRNRFLDILIQKEAEKKKQKMKEKLMKAQGLLPTEKKADEEEDEMEWAQQVAQEALRSLQQETLQKPDSSHPKESSVKTTTATSTAVTSVAVKESSPHITKPSDIYDQHITKFAAKTSAPPPTSVSTSQKSSPSVTTQKSPTGTAKKRVTFAASTGKKVAEKKPPPPPPPRPLEPDVIEHDDSGLITPPILPPPADHPLPVPAPETSIGGICGPIGGLAGPRGLMPQILQTSGTTPGKPGTLFRPPSLWRQSLENNSEDEDLFGSSSEEEAEKEGTLPTTEATEPNDNSSAPQQPTQNDTNTPAQSTTPNTTLPKIRVTSKFKAERH